MGARIMMASKAALPALAFAFAPVWALAAGGIEALLLGIRHPDKVSKIAAMAANRTPKASRRSSAS